MTTNITELAQRLKLEVHHAVSNFNPQMNIKTRDLKELIEALEKAQQKIIALQQRHEVDPHTHEIIDLKERIAELDAELEREREKSRRVMTRIAELESRTVTVKLPFTPEPSAFAPWVAKAFYQFHKDTVKSCVAVFSDACATAGIKLEVE